MAKIDTSTIEGYEGMSAEEKLAALEDYEFAEPDMSGYVKKSTYDKVASDYATLKRKHQTDEEARAEAEQQKDEELKSLRREIDISKMKGKLITTGYDEKSADEAATAYYDGDTEKFFSLQQKHDEDIRKKAKSDALKETLPPDNGKNGSDGIDYNKKAEEAGERGDYAAQAYYLRLASEQKD